MRRLERRRRHRPRGPRLDDLPTFTAPDPRLRVVVPARTPHTARPDARWPRTGASSDALLAAVAGRAPTGRSATARSRPRCSTCCGASRRTNGSSPTGTSIPTTRSRSVTWVIGLVDDAIRSDQRPKPVGVHGEADRPGAVRSGGHAEGRDRRRRLRRHRGGREVAAGRHRHVHDLRVVARDRRHVVGQHVSRRRSRRRLAPLLLLVQAARLDAHARPATRAAEVPRGDGRRVRPAPHLQLGVAVESATWDDDRHVWTVAPRRRHRRRVPRARERRRVPERAAVSRLARARRASRVRSSTPRAGSTSTT